MRLGLLLGAAAAAALLVLACGPRPDKPDAPADAATNPLGPNAGCYVCHMTFVREELSRTHLEAKVGCVDCHGTSAPHANDEDIGATKPDTTYTRAQVSPSCRKCHPTHDVAPEKLIAHWQTRRPAKPAEALVPPIVCTDCHRTHRIARTP